jgi:hypothetical protein
MRWCPPVVTKTGSLDFFLITGVPKSDSPLWVKEYLEIPGYFSICLACGMPKKAPKQWSKGTTMELNQFWRVKLNV